MLGDGCSCFGTGVRVWGRVCVFWDGCMCLGTGARVLVRVCVFGDGSDR